MITYYTVHSLKAYNVKGFQVAYLELYSHHHNQFQGILITPKGNHLSLSHNLPDPMHCSS